MASGARNNAFLLFLFSVWISLSPLYLWAVGLVLSCCPRLARVGLLLLLLRPLTLPSVIFRGTGSVPAFLSPRRSPSCGRDFASPCSVFLFPVDIFPWMCICINSSYVPLPFLSDPKTIHLALPSGHLCPCSPGPGLVLPPPVSGPPCVLVPLPPQKKTGMMDTDDFRACLISMGYNMVM